MDELQNMTEKCEQLESLVKEKDAMIGQLQKQIELIKYARDESCLKCKGDKRKGNDLNDEKLEGDRSEEIYTIGDKVWTYYSPDKRSYPAKILEVIDDKYTVEYTEDKARITVDGENLRFGTKRRR